jgi:hypothetical protein
VNARIALGFIAVCMFSSSVKGEIVPLQYCYTLPETGDPVYVSGVIPNFERMDVALAFVTYLQNQKHVGRMTQAACYEVERIADGEARIAYALEMVNAVETNWIGSK